jgi:3-mercaptopyruvate sulfurtransferase SseA
MVVVSNYGHENVWVLNGGLPAWAKPISLLKNYD